jgi:geranylgeranyl diphosphate synthase type II
MIDTTTPEPIQATLKRFAEGFDQQFSKFLESAKNAPPTLVEAMRYSALAPGKRVRPYLVTECCRLVGGTPEAALPAAAAIECIHVFSLIHDDLPALDNADLRRGRPTSHVRFGEAMALLAGDALLALALELLATHVADSARAAALVRELAQATGYEGMIAGQVADIEGESQPIERARVDYIHRFKTARLLEAACRMGALCGGADAAAAERLSRYGIHLGCAFQIADDLLDVTGSTEQAGKNVAKDAGAGKQTYPACVGIEGSREAARAAVQDALAALEPFGPEGAALRSLAEYVVARV